MNNHSANAPHAHRGIVFFLILLVWCSSVLYSQKVSYSLTNSLRYGSGKEMSVGTDFNDRKEYLDNISDLRVYMDNLTIGFRNDYDKPPEYGLTRSGIVKKFVEYNDREVNVRAGDLYALFSHGLALNLFENKALGFDNGLEGVRLQYKNPYVNLSALGGEITYVDPLTVLAAKPRYEYYTLRGASFECTPLKQVALGGNFVWSEARFPIGASTTSFQSTIGQVPELFLKFRLPFSFDLFASYAEKFNKVKDVDSSVGTGCYAALSQTGDGYGVTFEYKDYRFDIVTPDQRFNVNRPTRMFPFQNPPIVMKEHSFALLSRYPHVVDFNDEVGFQLDGFFAPSPELTLNVNCSMASRHYAYVPADSQRFTFKRKEDASAILPSLSDEKSPFWEFYADLQYYFHGSDSYVQIGFDRRNEVIYNDYAAALGSVAREPNRSVAFPALVQFAVSPKWSVKFSAEQQWVTEYMLPDNNHFYNQLVSFQVSRSPELSAGMILESTTNTNEIGGRTNWIVVDASYRIAVKNTVVLSYGAERGGTVCSNGICRLVYPFNGFRLSVLSTI